jgi:DNA repair protein RadD
LARHARRRKFGVPILRDYQIDAVTKLYAAWNEGAANVMLTAPTGSGKTVIMGHVIKDFKVPAIAIAHRMELIAQIAVQLNREEVTHSIIAPSAVVRQICALEMAAHGYCMHDPRSSTRVAGVDTLVRKDRERWMDETGLVIMDEAHHVQEENKFGKAVQMFQGARGLFLTAHALRGDNKGLGRGHGGLVDRLVVGVTARELISRGMLCGYDYVCAKSDIDLSGVHVGASGEFNQAEVRAAVHESPTITGDVVKAYLKFAPGKLGITFAVDIESGVEIAAAYRASGVPAEIITGETPLAARGDLMRQFRERRILQLVSVEVLGEGVDVPGVEVVSMARPTASFQLFAQQTGRALRLLLSAADTDMWNNYSIAQRLAMIAASPKPKAILIDHVQNWLRHKMPDTPREYTLESCKRKSSSGAEDLRACLECYKPYEKFLIACPYCGAVPAAPVRTAPQYVDGDMALLDPGVIQALEKEIKRVDGAPVLPYGVPEAHGRVTNAHYTTQQKQQTLRATMALYMGWQQFLGLGIREAQKKFFLEFSIDVMTAQTLNAKDAEALEGRVTALLSKHNIKEQAA